MSPEITQKSVTFPQGQNKHVVYMQRRIAIGQCAVLKADFKIKVLTEKRILSATGVIPEPALVELANASYQSRSSCPKRRQRSSPRTNTLRSHNTLPPIVLASNSAREPKLNITLR